ncbi:MAG TPA: hypothetical protein VGF68_09145, partial [Solirubrobacteraceae bacterium]
MRTAHQAIEVAGAVVSEVAERLGLRDHNGNGYSPDDGFTGEVVPDAEPRPQPPDPRGQPASPTRPAPAAPPRPAPPASAAPPPPAPPASAAPPQPAPPASAAPPQPAPPASAAPPPAAPQPPHVSSEPQLVQESAEPGAEDGAGAQIRIDEPWPAYRSLKARD